MGVADVEVEPVTRRVLRAEGKPVTVVIRNAGRAKFRALDRRLIVSEASAQGQLLAGVPFKPNGVPFRVVVIDVKDVCGRAGIVENNRDLLKPTPMCPGHISHDGELVRESLVNAEMENVRQIQVRAHALIEEDGLECARLWKCGQGRDRKSTRLNSSHSQISYAVF